MFQKWENINKICFHQQTSTFGRSHHIWCTFLHVCARVRVVVCQSLTDYDSSERTRFYFHFDRDTICFQCYCCNISRCENNDVELLLPHLCNSVSRAQIEIREAYIETIVWILCVCVCVGIVSRIAFETLLRYFYFHVPFCDRFVKRFRI